MFFDQCLLGACALAPTEGVTTFDYDDAEFKHAIVRQSSEVIIAITQDKLSSVAKHRVLPTSGISTLIIAGTPSKSLLQQFKEQQIDVMLVCSREWAWNFATKPMPGASSRYCAAKSPDTFGHSHSGNIRTFTA